MHFPACRNIQWSQDQGHVNTPPHVVSLTCQILTLYVTKETPYLSPAQLLTYAV